VVQASRWDSIVWPQWLPVRARLPLIAQLTGAVALTALLVSPWWSAIPVPAAPITATPHPVLPLPSAVAPSPMLKRATQPEPGRPAHLNLEVHHGFGSADLLVSVDGTPALETKVDGGGKRFKMFGKRAERGFTRTLDLDPGVRVVRVRVRSLPDKFDQTRIERFDLGAASVAALRVSADKSGLRLAADHPPAPANEPDPARPLRATPVPLPVARPPVVTAAQTSAALRAEADNLADLLQSLRSMLIAIAGFVASAATGFVVQEFLRSRKGLLFVGPERRRRRRASKVQASLLFLAVIIPALAGAQTSVPDGGRYSDAEKSYVPPAATGKVSDTTRRVTMHVVYGQKFDATAGPISITNPFMDPAKVLFVQMTGLSATADGGLVVGGRAGLDKDGHAVGTGFWKVAADGAVTPLYTRSTNTYGKTAGTKCEAAYARTHLDPENFAIAAGGALVKAIDFGVVRVGTDGMVHRIAGVPFACEESGQASQVRGTNDGAADAARFNMASRIAVDPQGNTWIVDQSLCALRRLSSDGKVTTVITPEQACGEAIPKEDRPGLEFIAWDAVHGELVTTASMSVARPVHNLFMTVWRIKPTGEFKRVLWASKVGTSPAKHQLDGITAVAVDPQGRIHIASRIMKRDGGSVLAVLRVNETGATVVPVTGATVPYADASDDPRDGAAARATFHYIRDMSFAPDGTLYLLDEHLVRKLDRAGQVSTWVF